MTDKDKLQVLYNYIKLVEPNEKIYLKDSRIFVDGFGASYMELYCKDSKFTAHSSDLNPNWLHKVFKVYKVLRLPFNVAVTHTVGFISSIQEMKDYLKMTDEDMLNTLYQYMKLVKPEEEISLKHAIVKYIFIDGPGLEFMSIYCKHRKLVAQITDIMEIPSWFMGLFHLQRITSSDALRIIPMYKMAEFYKYYTIEVKDKELLK